MEEVHLWRGSAEQRALRSRLGNLSRFAYFDRQLDYPDWRGKAVLDFGGNIGGLLRGSNRAIRPEDYYCADVLQEAMTEGRKSFPQANWIHFNRYNCSFNPEGIEGLPIPDMGIEFGMILAYSVFTHTTREEMNELVGRLQTRLAPGGALAFTFIDPHFNPALSNGRVNPGYYSGSCLKQRLEIMKRENLAVDVEPLLEKARDARWCILVNDDDLYVESENIKHYEESGKKSYCTFYTADYMKTIFPDAVVLPPQHAAYPPSVEAKLQHCCVLRKGKAASDGRNSFE